MSAELLSQVILGGAQMVVLSVMIWFLARQRAPRKHPSAGNDEPPSLFAVAMSFALEIQLSRLKQTLERGIYRLSGADDPELEIGVITQDLRGFGFTEAQSEELLRTAYADLFYAPHAAFPTSAPAGAP